MKFHFLLVLLCILAVGCETGLDENATPEGPYALLGLAGEKIIYVADHLESCVGVAVQMCMLVKENPEDAWEFWYSDITDFHYVAGTNYVLRITEKPIPNPPADGSSIEWIWIETLDTW